jgi:protoporphyrinogen oxidase
MKRTAARSQAGIVILGAGMAAMGAAHRLRGEGVQAVVFEKQGYPGGHTASFLHPEGFVFDDGPHISFTKDQRMQRLFAESVNQEYETIHARVNNHWKGHWIKHPAQCNLQGLPSDLLVDILSEMVEAKQQPERPIRNYAEWLIASYGETFARTFPFEYGLKYHTTPAINMTTEWVAPRLYRPDMREVFRGALSPSTADVHYISHFRYPSRGGFVSYLRPFLDRSDVRLGHQLVGVEPRERRLTFANGRVVAYEHLISSIPLPALVPLIAGVPPDVREAATRLACTSCVVVNVGVQREDISPAHWTYFYDQDFIFTRLSFPHMLSPHNVPPGCGSIQAEIYFSDKYKPIDRSPADCIEPTLADLRRCGLLREDDHVVFTNATLAPYANVIFDHDRPAALATVRGYLDEIQIQSCGRYGEWGYLWTDESFMSGEHAAEHVLDRMGSRRLTA